MTTTSNRPRARTLPLQGTFKKTAAHLDFASLAVLHYAQAWAVNRGNRKAPLSLILRRALAAYVAHLEAITQADATFPPAEKGVVPGYRSRGEALALKLDGKGRGGLCPASGLMTKEEAQRRVLRRLEALPALPSGDSWLGFDAVLYGAEFVARSRAEHGALEARGAGYLGDIARNPKGRLIGLCTGLAP